MDLQEYLARWYTFVHLWAAKRSNDPEAAERLLHTALTEGLASLTLPPASDEVPDSTLLLACEVAVVRASDAFDEAGYLEANRDRAALRTTETTPIEHFCETGWRWLLAPRRDFDVWWYWNEYLDPTQAEVNPFVHYLLVARHEGSPTRPVRVEPLPNPPLGGTRQRRVCLFAGYDIDGVVDDYVVAYLRDLSRHADIYYLADGVMSADELSKLDGITKGAWAVPHGRYDFGSYALLATEYVGWDSIDQYDELLLANDSCYLLRPLDEVFTRMETVAADWWGLQASKRDFDATHGHVTPLELEAGKRLHSDAEDWNPYYRLHVSSYFVVFRKRVMSDAGLRSRLSSVVTQPHKGLVIVKYEIGLSDYLIRSGYDFSAFVRELYPFHPLYSADHFTLLGQGFPLFKRGLLVDNPFQTPDLADWRERILALVPDAPVETIERNLHRVTPADRLARSLAIRTRSDGTIDLHQPLSRRAFRAMDRVAPKFDHWWAFPVCRYDHTFAGNERAVFEEVRDDPSIKKIILTRSRRVDVTGENVVIVPLESPEGQHYVARAGHIFVKHGPTINVPWPLSTVEHSFINLWHGIPLKRFGMAALELNDLQHEAVIHNNSGSRAIVASSRMDALAMSASFFPASYPDLWQTGLPRNDFIVREDALLPPDLLAAVERLRAEVAGRRLVLFLPTFKDGQADAYYRFTDADLATLAAWTERHNAVIGVREHMADRARTYSQMLAPLNPINVSSRRYPDLEVLYRVADALVSDYSSCLVDFLMTGRPVVSFAYDYDHYARIERGLVYELERVLPGPVCRTFEQFAGALDDVFRERTPEELEEYNWRRRIFFDHLDDQASWRVVQKVKGLYLDME
jgi:CDP-glycerol glycerophosphotransferase (TagB/SpsB family)